jgi:hypothetical protein
MDTKTLATLAFKFDAANASLRDRVTCFEHDLQDVQKAHRRDIDSALRAVIASRRELCAAVEEAPELFTNPKTLTLNGVRFGFRKEVDSVDVPNEETTIAACEELFRGADSNPVVVVKKSLVAAALKKLSPEEMELVGVQLVKGGDAVFCEPVEGDADKLVAALVKEARNQAKTTAAA